MKLKTYQARSMSDALIKVKKDLGKDAVILHTRTLNRGGVLGIGSRSFVEITATTDEKVLAFRGSRRAIKNPRDQGNNISIKPTQSERVKPQTSPTGIDGTLSVPAVDASVRRELSEIRSMVRGLLLHSERSKHPNVPADLIDYYTHLIGQEVAEELAVKLLDRVAVRLRSEQTARDARGRFIKRSDASKTYSTTDGSPSGYAEPGGEEERDPERVRSVLLEALVEMLPPVAPLQLKKTQGPTIVALVGPTGVGKTTTIAKLAANMKLREKKRVGLVTIDSYRIAAVEQLRTYAKILKVPLVSVLTPSEMTAAIEQMSDCDLILIDTAGRSQRDDPRIAELCEFLNVARPDQIHLVLSTTGGEKVIRQSIEKFSVLGPRHLVFTKIDEAVGFGIILNVLNSVDMRLSYLTNGQSVPDDIELGSARQVARLILSESSDKSAVLKEVMGTTQPQEANQS